MFGLRRFGAFLSKPSNIGLKCGYLAFLARLRENKAGIPKPSQKRTFYFFFWFSVLSKPNHFCAGLHTKKQQKCLPPRGLHVKIVEAQHFVVVGLRQKIQAEQLGSKGDWASRIWPKLCLGFADFCPKHRSPVSIATGPRQNNVYLYKL